MSTLSVRLPTSLHRQLRELAQKEGVSINQLITTAVAEKMAALLTVEYLEERAARGSRTRFDSVVRKVRARGPEPQDRIG
jgi:post-segregation antitoxin (ccd killing protein)